jgi:hypothetical protein
VTRAWAVLRVVAPALVTARAVEEGAPLAGATVPGEREVAPGRSYLPALPEGAVARRALPAGAALEGPEVRAGPRPGQPVAVLVRAGAVVVEQAGRAVPCRRDRACALLPTGRRVEGAWHDGRIEVEVP